jgi:hypothetical protein
LRGTEFIQLVDLNIIRLSITSPLFQKDRLW